MIGKLDEALNFNGTALRLRAERQQVIAGNIANADTPGFKAADFNFARALESAVQGGAAAGGIAKTSAKHIGLDTGSIRSIPLDYRKPGQGSIDGNSVEMDAERAQFADNAVRYEAALRFLNGQIKTMLSAVQG